MTLRAPALPLALTLALALPALLLAACGGPAEDGGDGPVEVRGALTLGEGANLPDGAFAVVEIADASSAEAPQAGAARVEMDGDGPYAFAFEVERELIDPEADYAVAAAAFSGEEAVLLSDPVAVEIDGRVVDAGQVELLPLGGGDPLAGGGGQAGDEPAGNAQDDEAGRSAASSGEGLYQCGDIPVIVEFGDNAATLFYADDEYPLAQAETEEGVRYESEHGATFLHDRGGRAEIEVEGEPVENCVRFF